MVLSALVSSIKSYKCPPGPRPKKWEDAAVEASNKPSEEVLEAEAAAEAA